MAELCHDIRLLGVEMEGGRTVEVDIVGVIDLRLQTRIEKLNEDL